MANEVAKRIYAQRMNYWKVYHREPNVVLLGIETFDQLKAESYAITSMASVSKSAEIFGMEIEQVHQMEYLAVGFIEKEWNPDETV